MYIYNNNNNYNSNYVYEYYENSDLKEKYEKLKKLCKKAKKKCINANNYYEKIKNKYYGLWKNYCDSEDKISEMLEIYANYYDEDCNKMRKKIFSLKMKTRNKKLKKIYYETMEIVDEIYENFNKKQKRQYAVFLKEFKKYKDLIEKYEMAIKKYNKTYKQYKKIIKKYEKVAEEYKFS